MRSIDEVIDRFMDMGFNKYEASILTYLMYLGEASALELSRVSRVPAPKTYVVLNKLLGLGLIKERPGRPSIYISLKPDELINRIIGRYRRQYEETLSKIERIGSELLRESSHIYLRGKEKRKASPLIRIISVGNASEEETKTLYREAKREIMILTQAFEYYPRIRKELLEALDRGVEIKILFRKPDELTRRQRKIQEDILKMLRDDTSNKIHIRFTQQVPLRGCIIDPSDNGRALFLVEEKDVPFEYREAAVTTNRGLIKSLSLMFNMLWEKASPNP